MNTRRKPRQLALAKTSGWGGKRKGAGRKPSDPNALPRVPHRPRARVTRHTPVHVTMRVLPHVWNLRTGRALRALRGALNLGGRAVGLRLCDFSIQGNHLHLVVEADSNRVLSRGMQSLAVRLARNLNRLMHAHGKVLSDRFHTHVLSSPAEVRHALRYVRNNHDTHRRRHARIVIAMPNEFSAANPDNAIAIVDALSYLLKRAFRALGPPRIPRYDDYPATDGAAR